MDLYAETILDHSKHPRHRGELSTPTVAHEEANVSCGDMAKVMLRLDGDRVAEMQWMGAGCAISQAALSMLAEELQGKTLTEIDALSKDDVLALLGVPVGPRRMKCALLGLHALKNALHAHRDEKAQPWRETVGEAD